MKAGVSVITQGEEGNAMYILADGAVSVSISFPGQPAKEVRVFQPGDYFGELALLDEGARSASALTRLARCGATSSTATAARCAA